MPRTLPSRRRFIAGSLALCTLPGQRLGGADCRPAITDLLGPVHRRGAPFRKNLREAGEAGAPLAMCGTLTDSETCKVLDDRLLDIWRVDAAGNYDMAGKALHLRGKFRSAATAPTPTTR